jgi:hypothetical protein
MQKIKVKSFSSSTSARSGETLVLTQEKTLPKDSFTFYKRTAQITKENSSPPTSLPQCLGGSKNIHKIKKPSKTRAS